MPIPNRLPNESEEDYIPRCLRAIKDDDIPEDQKQAICYDKSKEREQARVGETSQAARRRHRD
jgi:hypothetical protein